MKFQGIFKPLDELMFKLIDEINAIAPVRKLLDDLQSLPEDQQKIINQLATFIALVLPIVLVLFLFLGNQKLKSQIHLKEQVLLVSQENHAKNSEISFYGQGLMGPTEVRSQSAFQSVVNDILRSRSLNQNNVNITHFDQFETGSDLVQTVAGLGFSEFTTADFTNFVMDFIQRHRIRVQAVEIEKNPNTGFLQGSVEIIHFSRLTEES